MWHKRNFLIKYDIQIHLKLVFVVHLLYGIDLAEVYRGCKKQTHSFGHGNLKTIGVSKSILERTQTHTMTVNI